MITLEQAKALKPGDLVQLGATYFGQYEYTTWVIIAPTPEQTWPGDETIVQYMTDEDGYGLISYIFSDQLHRYALPSA